MNVRSVLLAIAVLCTVSACSPSSGEPSAPNEPAKATWPADFTRKLPPARAAIPAGVRDCGEDLRLLSAATFAAADCLGRSFEACEGATARVVSYTIEGDPIASEYTVVSQDGGCVVNVHTHSDDNFGQKGDFDATCTSMTRAPNLVRSWQLDGCSGSDWVERTP